MILASYVFNLSNDSQYNITEFKEFIINSHTSTQLSSGMGQLKVL